MKWSFYNNATVEMQKMYGDKIPLTAHFQMLGSFKQLFYHNVKMLTELHRSCKFHSHILISWAINNKLIENRKEGWLCKKSCVKSL